MAETQLTGIPIEDLQGTDSSNLTDGTKVIVEDDGTPVTRQCDLSVMADWINDRIEVGGRNLLAGTRDLSSWEKTGVSTQEDDDGLTMAVFPDQSELAHLSVRAVPNLLYSDVKNRVVTISFLARANEVDTASGYNGKPAVVLGITPSFISKETLYTTELTDVLTEEWKKHSVTIAISDDIFTSGTGTITDNSYFTVRFEHYSLKGAQFKAFKMEYGNVATDWGLSNEGMISSAQVSHTKSDGTETTVQNELRGLEYSSDKAITIGKTLAEIKDTDKGVALAKGVETNIGSTRAAVDNDYYTTTTGSDASITIKKSGLYAVSTHVFMNLDASNSQGNNALHVYKDNEMIDNVCIYSYSTYASRLKTSGIFYLPAGVKLTAKVKPSASLVGNSTFKGGDLTVIKID